jgi:hypothetical protein
MTDDQLQIFHSPTAFPAELKSCMEEMDAEINRLREGLKLITCESINAEYMAQNILDGLPPYHIEALPA